MAGFWVHLRLKANHMMLDLVEAPMSNAIRRNDAGVGDRTGSHARLHLCLAAVRREQPQYSQAVKRHPKLRTIRLSVIALLIAANPCRTR
jgi:hypothetical protein